MDMRFSTNAALGLRVPMESNLQRPAVMALHGMEGIVEGADYRGLPVLAALRKISGTPWFMVAKVDQEEIFAPLRQQTLMDMSLVGVLMLATLLVFVLLWREQKLKFFQWELAERKRMEEAVRALSSRQEAILEAVPDIVAEVDVNKVYTWMNPAGLNFFGNDAVGKEAAFFFVGKQDTYAAVQPLFKGDPNVVYVESWQRRWDGEGRLLAWWCRVQKDAGGNVTGALSTARDVTERRRAESALRESEVRYRALFNASADGILIADVETKKFKYANPALCRMLGYAEAELQTMGVANIHPKDAVQSVVAKFEAIARGEEIPLPDIPCLKKDGSVVHVDISGSMITVDGRPCNVGFFRDITGRKKAEERLLGVKTFQELLLPPCPIEQKLKLVTDAVVRLVDADFARVWIIRPGDRCEGRCIHAQVAEGPHVCRFRDRCLHLVASSGRYTHVDGKDHGRVPLGCYKIGLIASGDQAGFLTNEAASDPRVHNHAWAGELGLVSFAGYRLADPEGKTLGVLALFSRHAISMEEDALLDGIAQTTSLVIQTSRADEALKQERNLLRTLIDHIPDNIFVRDLSNRFVEANESFARLMGVARPSDLIGKRDADFYPPEVAADYSKVDQGVFAGNPVINRERALRFPNGRELVLLNTKLPFKNDKGEVVGLIGVCRDITERKQAEAELEYERNLLRMLLGNSPDHIYFKDTQSRFIQVSNSLADMFGAKSPDEMVGKTDFDFFDEAHARPALEDEQEIIRTGWPMIAKEEREVWKDGRVTWASTTKLPMRDAAGKIVGIMGVSRDITERKQAEEELQKFQFATDRAADAIFWMDQNAGFYYVNDQACSSLGYTREELTHLTLFDIDPAYTKKRWEEYWERLKQKNILVNQFESVQRRKDGSTFPIEVMAKHFSIGGVELHVAFVRDITERKRSEEALHEMQALYHSLVEHIPAAVFRKDGGGHYVFVNAMYCRLKGMTAEEILGKTPGELENIKPPRKPSILPKSRPGSGCW